MGGGVDRGRGARETRMKQRSDSMCRTFWEKTLEDGWFVVTNRPQGFTSSTELGSEGK